MLLLRKRADVNSHAGERCPLNTATKYGYEDIVRLLLEKGAAINEPVGGWGLALYSKCFTLNESLVRLPLDKKPDIRVPDRRAFGKALNYASIQSLEGTVRLLLGRTGNVDPQDRKDLEKALKVITGAGHPKIVVLLLEKGADYRMLSASRRNAALSASTGDYKAIAAVLCDGLATRAAKRSHREG